MKTKKKNKAPKWPRKIYGWYDAREGMTHLTASRPRIEGEELGTYLGMDEEEDFLRECPEKFLPGKCFDEDRPAVVVFEIKPVGLLEPVIQQEWKEKPL